MLQCTNAKIVIVHSEASKLSTNTSAPQLTLRCTSVTNATGGLAGLVRNKMAQRLMASVEMGEVTDTVVEDAY